MTDDRLVVGLVRGVHGLKGALRVEVLTDNPTDRFSAGSVLHVEGSERRLTIVSANRDGPGLLVHFAEVPDRRAADQLREKYLEADVTAAPLPAGTYFWHEIIGCAAQTTAGEALGTVDDIFRVGESEVYVIHGPRGEVLVPAVQSVIRELNPAERRLVIDADALGLTGAGEEDEEVDKGTE